MIANTGMAEEDRRLAADILAYFTNPRKCRNYESATSDVIKHFEVMITGAAQKDLMKHLLHLLCDMEKPRNPMLPTVWRLKEEFR